MIQPMSEWNQSLLVIWCAVTYWLGGQEIPGLFRGFKAVRRYLMPAGMYGLLFGKSGSLGLILAVIGLSAATHTGYQNKVWKYALTGALFSLPSLLLGYSVGVYLPPLFHVFFGSLSLRYNGFKWAFVGILTGISIGICYAMAINP